MRNFLAKSLLVLALVISAAGAAPVAYAQFFDQFGTEYPTQAAADAASAKNTADSAKANTENGLNANGSLTTQQYTDAAAARTAVDPKLDSIDSTYNTIMIKIMSLFAWLVGVAALLLDNAVFYTVVKMGDYVNKLSAIGVTWRILRDIANIMFIFGFIGAGIATILNVDQYGWKTKMLPMLLVGAIFLNFSLFITEAMIDGTNLFATQFYTQINGGPAGAKSFDPGFSIRLSNEGISNKLMNQLGLQTIYGDGKVKPEIFQAGNPWIIGFFGIILFIVTAFVLFSLAFILIARFVALIFFIILCPVAFMGLALPQMQYRAGQWWKNFLEQIITAPVLLLLLYVALAVITDAQFLTGFGMTTTSGGAATGFVNNLNLPGFASFILSWLVAMGLLLVVVIKAKSMSAFGAAGAIKLGGKLSFGATAWAGRRTVGRVSNYAARQIRKSEFGRSDMGKLFAGVADKGAKASFDVRGTGVLKNIGSGIDAGEAQKGGYHGREEELIKSRIDYAKTLRQTPGEVDATNKAKEAIDKENTQHVADMKPLEQQEQARIKKMKDDIAAGMDKKQAREEAQQDLEEIRRDIELEKNRHKTSVEDQGNIIKANSTAAAQKEYGQALKSKQFFNLPFLPRQPYDWPTAVGSARKEASSRIIGEADKDPILKKLDEMDAKAGKTTPSAPAAPAPAASTH